MAHRFQVKAQPTGKSSNRSRSTNKGAGRTIKNTASNSMAPINSGEVAGRKSGQKT